MADTHAQTGIPTTIEARFYDANGVLADDGTPTIGITKADGSVLIASGTATTSGGTGIRRFALPAQSEVNRLKATWTGTAQTVVTWVEVVGDVLFSIAALRAVKVGTDTPFNNQTAYPTQTLLDRRVEVTNDFERRAGWSFIPRYAREVFDGAGQASLVLSKFLCQRLLSVTIDGVAQTVGDYVLAEVGLLQRKAGGTFSDLAPQNVVVEYVHGFATPPEEVADAGVGRAASLLLPSQAGANVSTWTTPDGTTYSYDQAGQTFAGGRRYYGIPKIDAVLADPAYNARRGGVFA